MDKLEPINKQDLLLALADNLHDTMQQLVAITEILSENSLKIEVVGKQINNLTNELTSISSHQIEINNYISGLVIDINERAERLKENARLLNEEG